MTTDQTAHQPTDQAVEASETIDQPAGMGRRQLFRVGGLTVTLGALVAACSKSAEGEPGRVGYAPVPTALPTLEVNDAVYLRTATSIEEMILEVYGMITDSGELSEAPQAMLDRLIADHQAAVKETVRLTEQAGGEPYECPNAWYMDRIVEPIFEHIAGDPEQDIEPTDQPEHDMLVVVNGMEQMAASMYQLMVELLTEREIRPAVMALGAQSARHGAAFALLIDPPPDSYFNPALFGETVEVEIGVVPVYAIPNLFGTLASILIAVGVASSAGTRFSIALETPADNSYVYEGMTCDA
jgi:hypothetical protein